ncbi:MAG: 4-phosphopantoate--beta-alanine ligase [Thermoplasmatota archaeon]
MVDVGGSLDGGYLVTDIPRDHPRYASLLTRERLVAGVAAGLVAPEGLLAHGRGEAFDYLIGEQTQPFAERAAMAAAHALATAKNAVLSVNGNTAVLVPDELAELQRALACKMEVNLFHRTEARVAKLKAHLESHGATNVLGLGAEPTIPGLSSERARSTREGIFSADVVLVPLEDGDRCEALRAMGKTVIVVDLNPMSRSARKASITIVDNVTRAIPLVTRAVRATRASAPFDNDANLADALSFIAKRLASGDALR